jgi:hypothetical protein
VFEEILKTRNIKTNIFKKKKDHPRFFIESFLFVLKYKTKPNIFAEAMKEALINASGRQNKYKTNVKFILFLYLRNKKIIEERKINNVIMYE